ncbi:MAG: glutamate--tRNA ligase [Hyphomicrobiales bacterium]|nr:glutamate--tRNA ligase [Hyphomicrobiales bacterium]
MSAPVVRFAPSPTGRIHIGNARTALLNYLFAARAGGRFILRFDDTDAVRSTEEFARSIEVDLAWLGMRPHQTVRQSDRLQLYVAAAEKLKAVGRLYPAYETQAELDRRRKLKQARGLPPVYDRAALALTEDDRARLETEGRKPHWRFKLDQRIVEWTDGVRGASHIDCASLSDPVLMREDGTFLYTLTSVVDDIDLGVTDVIRGEDHVSNTAVQIQIFEALAGEGRAPKFAHHNLLVDATGGGLSKRTGSLSIASLRESGVEALAVAALAVLTGTSDEVHAVSSLVELAQMFDLAHISRNSAKFDPAELRTLTQRTLHKLDFESVRDRLAAHDIVGVHAEAFWLAVRGNLETFQDVVAWRRVVDGEVAPVIEDAELCRTAATLMPPEPWDETTWGDWTNAVKGATGRKGRGLFHPLRLALTGRENGPELAKLLPLIGRARSVQRLAG